MAEAGIVISQAQIILLATPHLTEPAPMVAPDPSTLPLTTCVVLTGIPSSEEPIIVAAEAVSMENPWTGSSLVILNPSVFTILHPPKKVPKAIDVAASTATSVGTWNDGSQLTETRSAVITPIVFWASLVPWLRLTSAEDTSWSR